MPTPVQAGFDSRAVANFVLDVAGSNGHILTHLSLHKIIYFCHGWYLVQFGEPLVRETFEAWKHGPVLKSIYRKLKHFGSAAISERITATQLDTDAPYEPSLSIESDKENFLRGLINFYSRIPAHQLVGMSHASGSPWHVVWNAPEGQEVVGMQITDSLISGHFLKMRRPN